MNDLVEQLMSKAGLTANQADLSLQTIKDYIISKFPMLEGAVENMFPASAVGMGLAATDTVLVPDPIATGTIPVTPVTAIPGSPVQEHGIMDKISDVIPSETGEKIETFSKNVVHKAEKAFDNVKDKIGGMFSGNDNK